MAFHKVNYEVYVALGHPAQTPLWKWAQWKQLAVAFDPLIGAARGKAALRGTQFLPNQGGDVKLGRLGWNDTDHQKWAHGSPINAAKSRGWTFCHIECWAPNWNISSREGRAPDVYWALKNELMSAAYKRKPAFNPLFLFAVEKSLHKKQSAAVEEILKTVKRLVRPKLLVHRTRPWGISRGEFYTNAIQDLTSTTLFKSENPHKKAPTLKCLAEKWDLVK